MVSKTWGSSGTACVCVCSGGGGGGGGGGYGGVMSEGTQTDGGISCSTLRRYSSGR